MVVIKRSREFKKHYKSRILPHETLKKRYKQRLELFISNRKSSILKDHKLSGTLVGTRSFSITGDIRVHYIERLSNEFVFLDIGTHPQIYGI